MTEQNTYQLPVTRDRPVVAQKAPGVHGVGAAMAGEPQNAPAGHGVGATEASGQYVVAAHVYWVATAALPLQK